jgi:hypothetical protein
MIVAIHQPEYLPWAGYFEKMARADVFVLLDSVQFSKGDFQNRTRIKGPSGPQWLSVPVAQKFPQAINEVSVRDAQWGAKHWKSLVSCYARAKHFREFADAFEAFYRRTWDRLVGVDVAALELVTRALGLEKRWVMASDLGAAGAKSDLVLNICKKLGATVYYSGRTGSTYLKREEFERAGIEILVQQFEHPVYEQMFMKEAGFVERLSVVDLLFNCGPQCFSKFSDG